MVPYLGDFAEDATVYIPFNTFDSNDPSASVTATNLADADIKVHKDTGLTQIATDGATVIINYDGITGNHIITIDTSVHADYATGSEYQVRIEGVTVDGATINAFIASFSIERAGGVLALMKATTLASIKAETALIVADTNELQTDNVPGLIATAQADLDIITGASGVNLLTATQNSIDAIETDTGTTLQAELDAIQAAVITNAAGADIAADIIALKAETVSILADSGELQTDWANGGRLDLIIDIIAADTTTDIPALIATAQADLDIITGATGVNLLAASQASLDAIEVDTSTTLQGELDAIQAAVITNAAGVDIAADIIALKAETVSILADTNELQTDDIPTLVAAIQTVVDKIPLSDGVISWNATALAAINAEVDTALDTAISELGVAVPTATPTLRTGLMLMYMALRNQTIVQTSGTDALEVHNDAGTLITKKILTDDGSDYTEAKMS